MDHARETQLFELADLILALGRQIHAAKLDPGGDGASWTPLESAMMRFVDRNPGTTAGAAAEATQMISSNFSRALRNLEAKGLVRRQPDEADGRRVLLYPTAEADANLRRLRAVWSRLLDGTIDDPAEIDTAISILRRIELRLEEG